MMDENETRIAENFIQALMGGHATKAWIDGDEVVTEHGERYRLSPVTKVWISSGKPVPPTDKKPAEEKPKPKAFKLEGG